MKIHKRICACCKCKKVFYCEGECDVLGRIANDESCYCPDCAKAELILHPDFYLRTEKCKSRFGGE